MTAQPTRDQLLDMTEDLGVLGDRPDLCDEVVDGLWAALTQAERRIARLEAQTSIRGRAVVIYRERAREAEARIKAVRDMHTAVELGKHSGSFNSAPDDHLVCAYCTDPDAGGYESYPCETLRALGGEE